MRKVLLLFAAIVCQCYLHATITQEEAFRIAEKFVRDTTNEIMVTNQLYSKGDSVKMWEGDIVCPFQQAWCVFIDFYPLHNWAHECSYVFIDALNGDIKQEFKSTPPIAVSKLWTKYRTYILPKELQSKHKSLFQERLATFRNKASSSQTSIHSIPQGSRPSRQDNPTLYAIIINCGGDSEYNYERFWNDCAGVYCSLRNHGYPRNNIYVALSVDVEEDDPLSNEYAFIASSLLDLDGDEVVDVQYPGTAHGISNLFYDISQEISANDQIFIYITGHGVLPVGQDSQTPNTSNTCHDVSHCAWYSALRQSPYYTPSLFSDCDLAGHISELNANIYNIVIQREDPFLQECLWDQLVPREIYPQRHCVISNATRTNRLENVQYDEYTYQWLSAVNQETPDGTPIVSDLDEDGYISMYEAHVFICASDSDYHSTPLQESNPPCLKYDLSLEGTLSSTPCLQADLYMKDNGEDYGTEPNITTDISYVSPDIWIEDAAGNRVDNPLDNTSYYVCVKVRNRGNETSLGTEVLHVHWTKAVIGGSWPDSWIENAVYDCSGREVPLGGEITPSSGWQLPQIVAGGEYTARIPWITPDNDQYRVCSEFTGNGNELWHYCLLVRLYDEHERPGEDLSNQPMRTFVLNSNNVVSKNIAIMSDTQDNTMTTIVSVVAPFYGTFSLRGTFMHSLYDFADGDIQIFITLSEDLYQTWSEHGNGITDLGGYRLEITDSCATIEDLNLSPDIVYSLLVEIQYNDASNDSLIYDISLMDSIGFSLGGERCMVTSESWNTLSAPERSRVSLESEKDKEIICHPNPMRDIITIKSASEVQQVVLLNAIGQAVLQQRNSTKINVSTLPNGVYTIIVKTTDGTFRNKLIKN